MVSVCRPRQEVVFTMQEITWDGCTDQVTFLVLSPYFEVSYSSAWKALALSSCYSSTNRVSATDICVVDICCEDHWDAQSRRNPAFTVTVDLRDWIDATMQAKKKGHKKSRVDCFVSYIFKFVSYLLLA